MSTPQWRRWLDAIHAEVDGQKLAGCWHWTRLPPGAPLLRNVLVLTTKLHADFTVERMKARYCVDGSCEKPGEYADVCAHVAQLSTFKTQCACTAELEEGKVYSGDWTQAYLCAINTMPQYMREYDSMLPKFDELGNRLVLCISCSALLVPSTAARAVPASGMLAATLGTPTLASFAPSVTLASTSSPAAPPGSR
jgi:hypothetical protein